MDKKLLKLLYRIYKHPTLSNALYRLQNNPTEIDLLVIKKECLDIIGIIEKLLKQDKIK